MLTRYKKQRKALKNSCERCQNLSQDEKTKSANVVVIDIEIFLKKKKKKINMVVNDIEIF